MKKAELISAIAAQTGFTKKDSEKALTATFDAITEALVKGEKVQLFGFGIFDVKNRPARQGHNPKTKEVIQIPATRTAQFRAGKALKDAVAK